MAIEHVRPAPSTLPFRAQRFGWDDFERFCLAWLVSGTTLPNFDMTPGALSRLRIVEALRYGATGEKQHGIDFLITMENRATWVAQCKHQESFSEGDAKKAITKAEKGIGKIHPPAHYLLWVTGKITAKAQSLVHQSHPNWTLWSGERLAQEFLQHTPHRQALRVITNCFGMEWAKAFFPLPDSLLISSDEFFSHWSGHDRLFHHGAAFVGQEKLLETATGFALGGKGRRALILSAPGGIGKTRLMRAIAEKVEISDPTRQVLFVNPDRPRDAEPPRAAKPGTMSVFHDDAHRMDIPRLLLAILAHEGSEGSRLILATRPDAEAALRQQLMNAGYTSADIEQVQPVPKLRKAEMVQLAESVLDTKDSSIAIRLADLSHGCTLITLVGAELLRRGDLKDNDLLRSEDFRNEVFHRFEGQELERLRGDLPRSTVEKLLRSIALLSPWDDRDRTVVEGMANFLGCQRGQVEAARDSLLGGGLLLRTEKGLHITPDLLSDHLVYSACYERDGTINPSFPQFQKQFREQHAQTIFYNLAAAEWGAVETHGQLVQSVAQPFWEQFLQEFNKSSFWERSQILARWAMLAAYQPLRSLELAEKAMELNTAPQATGYAPFDAHEQVLSSVPGLVKPVAIWSDEHRRRALGLLWRLDRDFAHDKSDVGLIRFGHFAEIAAFDGNFPSAPMGVLDWLEQVTEDVDASFVIDRPCGLLGTVLRPFFVEMVERTTMWDEKTMTIAKLPLSVSKTREVRHRALALINEQIIPRGTVAATNVIEVLAEAFRQVESFHYSSPALDRSWRPERQRALAAIAALAKNCQHPLIHFNIRRNLSLHIKYGWDEANRAACERIVSELPDSFELRLARLTLSSDHDDSLTYYAENRLDEDCQQDKERWQAMLQSVAGELISRHPDAIEMHNFLCQWDRECSRHGFCCQPGGIFVEIARRNQALALEVLDVILMLPESCLAGNAANLICKQGELASAAIEAVVLRGLAAPEPVIVCSFLNSIQFSGFFQSPGILEGVLKLGGKAEGRILRRLLEMISSPDKQEWKDRLIYVLLDRPFSSDGKLNLVDAVQGCQRYGAGFLSEDIIDLLLDRLVAVPRLEEPHAGAAFLNDVARRYPRRVYEFLIKRIERSETDPAARQQGLLAIPQSRDIRLDGIESEPDFEKIASDLLSRYLNSKEEDRWPWQQLFVMVVSRTSSFIESLLLDCLPQIQTGEDLHAIARLTRFEGSLVVFRYPRLTEAILKKARKCGTKTFEEITLSLVHGVGPMLRSYNRGELDVPYRYLREEAEKAANRYATNPTLSAFFQKVIEREIAYVEYDIQTRRAMMTDDW